MTQIEIEKINVAIKTVLGRHLEHNIRTETIIEVRTEIENELGLILQK